MFLCDLVIVIWMSISFIRQAASIQELGSSIDEIADKTKDNAKRASEELSGQSQLLKEMISGFKLKKP